MAYAAILVLLLLNLAIISANSCNCHCPPNYVPTNGRCYYFSGKSVSSWQQAMDQCSKLGAQLLSIESQVEHFMIAAFLDEKKSTGRAAFWTSGSDEGHDGQWVWKATGENFTYTRWDPGQPDNILENEHCVHLVYENFSTTLNDAPCDQDWTWKNWPLYYICERSMIPSKKEPAASPVKRDLCQDVDTTCAGIALVQSCNALSQLHATKKCPEKFVLLAGKCYHFSDKITNWETAVKQCEELNSDLVSIESHTEAFALNHYLVQQTRTIAYWTSGSDAEVEGEWKWTTTEQPFTYTQWCDGQPDNARSGNEHEHYLHLYHISGVVCWNDAVISKSDAMVPIHYICESPVL